MKTFILSLCILSSFLIKGQPISNVTLNFDGVDDFVDISFDSYLPNIGTAPFTIEAIIKIDSTTQPSESLY